ncbi:MAG: thiamine phosphate synthase [Terriglobales bacterium]
MRGFYPILDLGLAARRGLDAADLVSGLAALGAPAVQLRAKQLPAGAFLHAAESVVRAAAGIAVIINDRVDIARLAGATGVHLGQTDLPPRCARKLLGAGPWIGYSTHSTLQVRAAMAEADSELSYLAIGPVFPTGNKENPDPVVGLAGIASVRTFYPGPLVAIGGISLERAAAVWAAGADAVAVIGGWLEMPDPLSRARDYMLAFERFSRQSDKERGTPKPRKG